MYEKPKYEFRASIGYYLISYDRFNLNAHSNNVSIFVVKFAYGKKFAAFTVL